MTTMRTDFCALILTHGRPDNVITYKTLRKYGYTGRIVLLVDDEDASLDEYLLRYGAEVEVFSKTEIAKTFDEGDNFAERRAIIYARNASFDVARRLGFRYFIQLDDDYTDFRYRQNSQGEFLSIKVRQLDVIFDALVKFLADTPFLSVAIGQGGDAIGGRLNPFFSKGFTSKRKAMNTFICDVDRPFKFFGKLNEDVNVYTCEQRRGGAFLSFMSVRVNQVQTQLSTGGMTQIYLDQGTYVKSFYSVMYAPSCVKISMLHTAHGRIHHQVSWDKAAPKIVSETYRKQAEAIA
jgi:hypothetical protein